MKMIKALFFDLNGTLIDILTDEHDGNIYRTTANFLSYYGICISPGLLKERYFDLNRQQRSSSSEEFPEFDVAEIFSCIISDTTPEMPEDEKKELADSSSRVFRAASRLKLEPYPGVKNVLNVLKDRYSLAAVSDGQKLWAEPEMRASGLDGYFSTVIVSGNYGFRKPDKRMYEYALEKLDLKPEEVVFIGNDMYRDIYGAKNAGMKTVFFKSNQGDHSPGGAAPDYIIYNFDELMRAIAFLEEKEKK